MSDKMNSHIFAQKWLEREGLFDKDSDYSGKLGEKTLEVIDFMAKQGHSGGSMWALMNLLNHLYEAYNNPAHPIWGEYWHSDEGKALVAQFIDKEVTSADIDEMMDRMKKQHEGKSALKDGGMML